ncbi:flagellar motor protein MotB [Aggregatimonas sangjinii]|uniref:Flagellar motor protein MotB n=1 Tax=Aggregatimonas sangjinii TaxID=2583587 RepID=A0A5B7SWH3_9FLAO|nr:OmpA family protein [Aggregatimonas sangjinii]QCX01100.1 flagellar motor protein MotB [Aggregatimonas sangjinii]
MKKIYLFIALFATGIMALQAQDAKRAKTYFDRAFYSDAIPLYEELAKNNRSKETVRNLADSYYNTYQLPKAAKWYSYLTSVYGENLDENYFFKYSQTLKSIGEYAEATEVLMEYYTKKGETQQVEELRAELVYLENVAAIGERFTMKNLALNTPTSEFGAAEINSNLVYSASEKNQFSLVSKPYRWNNQAYLDLYQHALSNLNLGDSVSTGFSKKVNTKMHEGTFALSKDGQTLYFTRNNFIRGKKRTDSKKISNLKIYKASLTDGEWGNIEELPFNSDDFSTEHPALSHDGRTLYFASDRPGGLGSFDLYKVSLSNNGEFGEPENLGAQINTERKEQFPFVDASDDLYFSSNGQPGYGLLDIFVAKKQNGTYQKPDNIGKPLNSGFDDFAYNLNTDGKTGYFSSNRPDGKGSDDIYSFVVTKPLIIADCQQFITGTVTDKKTGLPLANSMVSLLDAEGKIIETLKTQADASFEFTVQCSAAYRIEAKKEAYDDNCKSLRTSAERDATQDGSLSLFSVQDRAAENLLAQQKKQEEAQRKAQLKAERKQKEEKVAEEERIRKEAATKEREKIAQQKAEKERLRKIEQVIAKEEAIVKQDERIVFKTEEIHFDYSLWYLRRESRERLAKVIEIMKANPGMVIEIGTHTDIRGNDQYNRDLSQKRADAAKKFMVENGIDSKRVVAKGYGESKPIVKCETEESCSEEDHEWNRRCELVVVKWE